jgi:hypothetical protein
MSLDPIDRRPIAHSRTPTRSSTPRKKVNEVVTVLDTEDALTE